MKNFFTTVLYTMTICLALNTAAMAQEMKAEVIHWWISKGESAATVLCLVGGMIGTGLGVVASNLYANLSAGNFVISYPVIALGLAVSALGGITAGFYPAYQSSLLDPVSALQSE